MLLTDSEKGEGDNPDFLKSFAYIHNSNPTIVATPRRFLEFLKGYQSIYNLKREEVIQRQMHLQAGVSKLNEAKEVVKHLEEEAAKKEVILNEKQGEANKALQLITETMKNANEHKIQMETLKDQTIRENEKIAERKVAIDRELAEIEPLVRQAKEAVGNIKTETLTEVRYCCII